MILRVILRVGQTFGKAEKRVRMRVRLSVRYKVKILAEAKAGCNGENVHCDDKVQKQFIFAFLLSLPHTYTHAHAYIHLCIHAYSLGLHVCVHGIHVHLQADDLGETTDVSEKYPEVLAAIEANFSTW